MRHLPRLATFVAATLLGAGLTVVATTTPAAAGLAVTIAVTTTADEQNGPTNGTSLREAIAQAQGDGSPTTVVLVNGETYQLTDCTAGDLDHVSTEDLVLSTGPGTNATVEQMCADERILEASGGGDLVVERTTLTGGDGNQTGGALRVVGIMGDPASLTLRQSLVLENAGRAVVGFGPITVEDSTFLDNQDLGAIEGLGTSIEVRRSTFSRNGTLLSSPLGGAVYASSTNTVVTIEDSTFNDNQAAKGGAVFNFFNDTTVTDATFVGNDADDGGGAIFVQNSGDNLTLSHVTFSGNSGGTGPTEAANVQMSTGTFTSFASVFGAPALGTVACQTSGAVTSDGGNYEQGSDSCELNGPSDVQDGDDPLLGGLADNGGSTLTMLPGLGSPVVDLADPVQCADVVDQAGTTRPIDGDFDGVARCDAGAVERPQGQPFTDVSAAHPFFTEIGWMAWNGISNGSLPGPTYKPSDSVSRQAMSAFLYRLADASFFGGTPTFSDVPVSNPFFDEIEWMNDEGITTGFPGGLFRPSVAVTRQSMSAFMYRLADPGPGPFPDPGFADVSASNPFFLEISWMADEGITTGFPGSPPTFKPSAAVSRQAMAAFMQRLAPVLAAP